MNSFFLLHIHEELFWIDTLSCSSIAEKALLVIRKRVFLHVRKLFTQQLNESSIIFIAGTTC